MKKIPLSKCYITDEVKQAAMRALDAPVIPLGMSEFRKMDGGLSCLSLRF